MNDVPIIVFAFLVGMGVLYGFYKIIQKMVESQNGDGQTRAIEPMQAQRLAYYEKELIDMRVRLDAMELEEQEEIQTSTKENGQKNRKEPPQTSGGGVEQIKQLRQMIEELEKKNEEEADARGKTIKKKKEELSAPEPKPASKKQAVSLVVTDGEDPNSSDYVLRLITNKVVTSRDMQTILKKSREHTSRLMKRLFENGLIERDASVRPYTYSITEKGRKRLGE